MQALLTADGHATAVISCPGITQAAVLKNSRLLNRLKKKKIFKDTPRKYLLFFTPFLRALPFHLLSPYRFEPSIAKRIDYS